MVNSLVQICSFPNLHWPQTNIKIFYIIVNGKIEPNAKYNISLIKSDQNLYHTYVWQKNFALYMFKVAATNIETFYIIVNEKSNQSETLHFFHKIWLKSLSYSCVTSRYNTH